MIRAYLRASTQDQNANRAKDQIKEFAKNKGVRIAGYYSENVSGRTLDRPELIKLISDSEKGDVILIEKLDRLSRLPYELWMKLKAELSDVGINIVVLDQPQTHISLIDNINEQQSFITKVLTDFMIDLAAGMARDDYETRLKRQRQGIEKAKENGKYKGKPFDMVKRGKIKELIHDGKSWNRIIEIIGCSRGLVASVVKEVKAEAKNNADKG